MERGVKVTPLVAATVIPIRRKSSDGSYKGRALGGSELSSRSFKLKTPWGLVSRAKSLDASFKAGDSLRDRVAKLESGIGGQKGPAPNDAQPPSRAASAVGKLKKIASRRSSIVRKTEEAHHEMVTLFNLRKRRRSSVTLGDVAAATAPRVPTIHPHSTPLRLWHMTLALVIVYQMISIPFNMGFNPNMDGTAWQVVDRVTDVLFVLDILVNFNVAFYESFPADDQRHLLLRYSTDRVAKDKFLVHSHARIAGHYIRGWLWLDLLAAFPVDIMGNATDGRDVNYLGMIRILRIPRLAGIFRVLKFLKNAGGFLWWFQYSKGSIVMRLLRLIAVTIYIVHVMACSWYPVGSWPGGWGDANFVPNDTYKNYVRSYYAMMMVVMGQDILPVHEYEMAYLSMASIVGAVVIATVFGNVSILVESLTSDSDTYHDKMEDVYESMQHLGLPHELQQRVHLYYTYLWQQYHTLDGKPAQFVSELSTNLQREVMLYLNARMIRSVPMMQECSPEVVQEIVLNLETRIYMPEDYIVSAGEMGTEMFFIQRGECEVIVAKEKARNAVRPVEKTKRIAAGDYFGEIALMMDCRRTASVRARTFCVLGVLDRAHFSSILSRFKEDRAKLEAMIMNKYENDIHRPQVSRKASTSGPPRMGHAGGGGPGLNKVALRMLHEATSAMQDVSGRVTKLEASMVKLTEAMAVLAAASAHEGRRASVKLHERDLPGASATPPRGSGARLDDPSKAATKDDNDESVHHLRRATTAADTGHHGDYLALDDSTSRNAERASNLDEKNSATTRFRSRFDKES